MSVGKKKKPGRGEEGEGIKKPEDMRRGRS
jgi:hypothetical protein